MTGGAVIKAKPPYIYCFLFYYTPIYFLCAAFSHTSFTVIKQLLYFKVVRYSIIDFLCLRIF
ncbi:Uncharacterised protein [Porphyromonas macacae]|uniref:Uncharacterized protein n=1 Tax=Porphyromonas macacae TaxID=28115 RepID=A0A379DIK2_9PORP|nr:Uncharacterised protein [Porphyromonas macacae]